MLSTYVVLNYTGILETAWYLDLSSSVIEINIYNQRRVESDEPN